jgi:hypothetical protein
MQTARFTFIFHDFNKVNKNKVCETLVKAIEA